VKEVNFHKPGGIHSLSIRFAVLVFLLTFTASAAIAYAVIQMQHHVLLRQEKQELKLQAAKYARQLDQEFLAREKRALSANAVVSRFPQLKAPEQQLRDRKSVV